MAKRKRAFTQKQIAKAYASFFNSPEGEIVLWDLRDQFVERTCLDPEASRDKTLANAGKQFVVLYIQSLKELGESDASRGTVSAEPERAGSTVETVFDPVERNGSRMGNDDSSGES